MIISRSAGRKVLATSVAALVFAFLFDATVFDSRHVAQLAELSELASTVKPRPRYLLIVRALAGDSTITKAWPFPADLALVLLCFAI